MTHLRVASRLSIFLVFMSMTACSLSDMVGVSNEGSGDGDKLSKAYIESRAGGISLFLGAHRWLANAASEASRTVALFTDELVVRPIGSAESADFPWISIDARLSIPETFNIRGQGRDSELFEELYSARTQAMQARDILSRYADDSLIKYKGLAYLVEGYAVLMIAENFCNGMPLSVARYGTPIEYTRGFSTTELFIAAGKIFDSAENSLNGFSSYLPAAQIGKMRSYAGRGLIDSAYNVSITVESGYEYNISYIQNNIKQDGPMFWTDTVLHGGSTKSAFSQVEVVNMEGGVGREWFRRSPVYIDPRVPVNHSISNGDTILPLVVRPKKYVGGDQPFPLARGIEALMIRAEYLLGKNDASWIEPINEARSQIGMGDVIAPASKAEAVNLLFNERAAWMYMEGRRLGDMRRLVRQYERNPYSVYPSGLYTRAQNILGVYGTAFAFDPPMSEYQINYKYNGCADLNP